MQATPQDNYCTLREESCDDVTQDFYKLGRYCFNTQNLGPTSSRSAHRCMNASTCAKIGDSEKSQGRADLAVTAAAVCWYSAFQLFPASMHCCNTAETFVTLGENTSGSLMAAQQRLMISLLTCTKRQIGPTSAVFFSCAVGSFATRKSGADLVSGLQNHSMRFLR